MFRQAVAFPTAATISSTTSTTVMTLTVPAQDGKRVNITGFELRYAVPPTTGQPYFDLGGGNTVPLVPGGVVANTYGQYQTPISGDVGRSVGLVATTTAGNVMVMFVHYFYS